MTSLDPRLAVLFLVGYVAVQIGIGYWASRRVHSDTDYFIAGRKLGMFSISLSLFATWFGAETVLSSSAEISAHGLSGGRGEPFGYAICLFAMGFLIAGAFRAKGYVTLADFFRDRFGRIAELACVWLTIPISIIWAAAQLLALAALMHTAIGAPYGVTLIAATLIVMVYTAFGGLLGDVATDIVQSFILVFGLVVVFGLTAARFGGVGELFAAIEPAQLSLIGEDESWLARIDMWAIPILGSLVTQEAISRFLGARDVGVARRSCWTAGGIYLTVGLLPVVIGLAGAHLNAPGAAGDNYLPALVRHIAHPMLFLLFSGALLSAILSTVDSNILSTSSLVSVNLFAKLHARASERLKLMIARGVTVGAGFFAYLIAAGGPSIRELIVLTSVLGQAGLLVAVLFGLHSRFGNERAAVGAVIACAATNLLTLAVWPIQTLLAEGETLVAAAAALVAGDAPSMDGAFLFSVLASVFAYVAVAAWERRVAVPRA